MIHPQHYWQTICDFDERLGEPVWTADIAISLEHPSLPSLRRAFQIAWLALIEGIEERRKGVRLRPKPLIPD
jgi:hypothetical protein